ncbi:MAG TPA: VOC family protein [Stellaceae bacterium]|nr:VOC family protein [Stellaceae bacterium]
MATVLETKTEAPSFEFVGLMHEGVPCTRANLDACIKFYLDVLGLKLLPRPKALDDLVPGAWIGDSENRVQFHLIAKDDEYCPGPAAPATPAGRHTAWMVKDIEQFCARMRALGIKYDSNSSLIGAPQVFVQDPAGHTWEFQGPLPRR